jgi:hypothetical protein
MPRRATAGLQNAIIVSDVQVVSMCNGGINGTLRGDIAKPHECTDRIHGGWNKARSAGGLGADGLVDYFGNPDLGDNTYAASIFCSRNWSPDGGHLNDRGKVIMARIESRVIEAYVRNHR